MRNSHSGLIRALLAVVVLVGIATVPSSAYAGYYTQQGYACRGTEAPGCAWINIDTTNQRVRSYGQMTDIADSHNYNVSIYNIELKVFGVSWQTVTSVCDCDGWFDVTDSGNTGLWNCGGNMETVLQRQWQGYSTGGPETVWSGTINCGAYP